LIEVIKATVARTGTNAFLPGKAVFSLKLKEVIAIPKNPSQGRMRIFFLDSGKKRSRAPKPSSQARVGKEE